MKKIILLILSLTFLILWSLILIMLLAFNGIININIDINNTYAIIIITFLIVLYLLSFMSININLKLFNYKIRYLSILIGIIFSLALLLATFDYTIPVINGSRTILTLYFISFSYAICAFFLSIILCLFKEINKWQKILAFITSFLTLIISFTSLIFSNNVLTYLTCILALISLGTHIYIGINLFVKKTNVVE